MENNNNNQSFLQFSDQLRHQTSNLANFSINDSIWGSSYGTTKRTGERRNFDIRVGGDLNSPSTLNGSSSSSSSVSTGFNNDGWNSFKQNGSEFNGFTNNNNNNNINYKPKANSEHFNGFGLPQKNIGVNGAFNKGIYSKKISKDSFLAASFGGSNIDPTAWEDKKCAGESRFPAQVRVITRKICEPLEEDSFRPILHHYDGPKFRLELNVPEALSLLDIFEDQES
ncbi:hypothetical protein G4B88_006482 [Cannabis sativa]|uniref:DCD domain-containing protein n=1 Tax=Cannabis sativa TaxID=3483 RepID=A0A7J6H2L1_CANSA|nr:hypothetical protein G4B88_006482 [Cannabis sativa]